MLTRRSALGGLLTAIAMVAEAAHAQATPPSAQPGGMPGAQTQSQSTTPSTLPSVQTAPAQTGLATDPSTGLQAAPQQAAAAAQNLRFDARAAGSNPTECPDPNAPIYPGSGMNSAVASGDYVELERTACRGTCPVYIVRLNADGSVQWQGKAHVAHLGASTSQADPIAAARLIRDFRDHGFARLCGSYSRQVTDATAAITTLSIGHQVARVRDYANGGPAWLADLDLRIEALANTHAWRHGDAAREHFGETRLIEDAVLPKPGVTPMMRAAAADHVDQIRTLLGQDAAIDAEDASGWTALMYAAGAARLSTLRYLIENGAHADRRSHLGETLLFAAAASPYDGPAKLRLLVQAGAPVNGHASDGTTALMEAAKHFWIAGLVETLLALGADPGARSLNGQQAVDVLDHQEQLTASPAEYQAVRELLLKAKAGS